MLSWFSSKPVLDEDSIRWLFDTFLWAEQSLEPQLFYQQTSLILPNDEFFPVAKEQDHFHMAKLILNKVQEYMHLKEIPCKLIEQNACQLEPFQLPTMNLAIRGQTNLTQNIEQNEDQQLPIPYSPAQIKNPQAMIAYFAQTLSYFVLLYAPDKPEDVEENILQLSEVLAVFTGFGIIQANSAFNYHNSSCSSCSSPSNDRNSYLSQFDITYALAIFCVIKGIDKSRVLKFIKSNLKTYFKKAYQQVKARHELKQFSGY